MPDIDQAALAAEASAIPTSGADSWQPLAGVPLELHGTGVAIEYAHRLLRSLGAEPRRLPGPAAAHPALAWARSGAMALTGTADKPGQMCPAPIASCVDGALAALRALAGEDLTGALPDASLLGERAAIAGLRRAGRVSAGGACRLLPCADAWLALSLARPDDWQLLPAWLECGKLDSWPAVADAVVSAKAGDLVERGRMLGLALALSPRSSNRSPASPTPWCRLLEHSSATGGKVSRGGTPLVVDLSSLWAGPLCAQLLRSLGARVVKVESLGRPDGARLGPAAFHQLMNGGKASVALDFANPADIDKLCRLLSAADIVVESARPRALRQLGIDASAILAKNPRLTWLSITGHGRSGDEGDWIAYGDDAGVAAGLSAPMHDATGDTVFCGDAIADPLTGVHAALAAWSAHRAGGGVLIGLALAETTRHCLEFMPAGDAAATRDRWRRWQDMAIAAGLAEALPTLRGLNAPTRPFGADTTAVFAELGMPC